MFKFIALLFILTIASLSASAQTAPDSTYCDWLGERCIVMPKGQKGSYYNWKRDISYAGLPLLAASFPIKQVKRSFRAARFTMSDSWRTNVDDYSQYAPYAVLLGLKVSGYQGRSSWSRMLASTAAANLIMVGVVNSMKYSIKERRPDNSSANSFPSGHTATAFCAATILHKEYGLTRSPWFSVAGYGLATTTGIMRVLNNRHWISDVLAGAGIGIMSAELGYWLMDLAFQNKGIRRTELSRLTPSTHPSFLDIQLGAAWHPTRMRFDYSGEAHDLELGVSSAAGVEGAYFLTPHVGLGAMARVTTTPVGHPSLDNIDLDLETNMSSSHFSDASVDVGVYGNLPLGRRFSLGAKALTGVRFSGGVKAHATDTDFDVKITANNTFNYVLGLSCSYYYKDNFAWKAFVDFDGSRKAYSSTVNMLGQTYKGTASTYMPLFTVGGAFSVNF